MNLSRLRFTLLLILTVSAAAWPGLASAARMTRAAPELAAAPVTALPASPQENSRLLRWIQAWSNGQEDTVVGAYAPGAFAHRIVQQPQNNPLFVSRDPQALTEFRRAARLGSLGLLAHNFLAGAHFLNVETGAPVYVVWGDGSFDLYRVERIADYQAISPYLYRDLRSQRQLNDLQLLEEIYSGQGDRLVLQTCLEKDGNLSWGRRFVLAMWVAGGQAWEVELGLLAERAK